MDHNKEFIEKIKTKIFADQQCLKCKKYLKCENANKTVFDSRFKCKKFKKIMFFNLLLKKEIEIDILIDYATYLEVDLEIAYQ